MSDAMMGRLIMGRLMGRLMGCFVYVFSRSGMSVKGILSTKEVVAKYSKDEAVLIVVRSGIPGTIAPHNLHCVCALSVLQKLKVPECYPLQRIGVSCEQLMGVTEAQWRRWELQMIALLSHRVCG